MAPDSDRKSTDLQITQVRSLIGSKQDQRATLRGLGLRRIRHTVVQPDRPEIRGMIAKVSHLVEVVEADGTIERPLRKRASETRKSSGKISSVEQHTAGLGATDAPDRPTTSTPAVLAEDSEAEASEETGTSSEPGANEPAEDSASDATDSTDDAATDSGGQEEES